MLEERQFSILSDCYAFPIQHFTVALVALSLYSIFAVSRSLLRFLWSLFLGIGPKTAYNLIKKHHSIEEVIKHLDKEKYTYASHSTVMLVDSCVLRPL